MKVASRNFAETAASALEDAQLQKALGVIQDGFVAKRAEARAALPEFDALKAEGKAIKEHALAHLDHYLEAGEAAATAAGLPSPSTLGATCSSGHHRLSPCVPDEK